MNFLRKFLDLPYLEKLIISEEDKKMKEKISGKLEKQTFFFFFSL